MILRDRYGEPWRYAHATPVETLCEHCELRVREFDHAALIHLRPNERRLLQSTIVQPESQSVPHQHLQPCAALASKHEALAAVRIATQRMRDLPRQPIERQAHIDRFEGKPNANAAA